MRPSFFLLSLLLLAASPGTSRAMGRTDNSAIEATLERARAAGFDCRNSWQGVRLSDVPPGGTFNMSLVCRSSSGQQRTGSVLYRADGNQFARCRDITALSISLSL